MSVVDRLLDLRRWWVLFLSCSREICDRPFLERAGCMLNDFSSGIYGWITGYLRCSMAMLDGR